MTSFSWHFRLWRKENLHKKFQLSILISRCTSFCKTASNGHYRVVSDISRINPIRNFSSWTRAVEEHVEDCATPTDPLSAGYVLYSGKKLLCSFRSQNISVIHILILISSPCSAEYSNPCRELFLKRTIQNLT